MLNISLCSKYQRLLCIAKELNTPKLWLSTSSVFHEEKPNNETPKSNPAVDMLKKKLSANYRPNKFEKYLLVWMKKYPSVADVPRFVTDDQMEFVRNWARIKINILLCIVAAIGCGIYIWKGKQDLKKGESLYKMNRDWHKKMDEEAAKKEST